MKKHPIKITLLLLLAVVSLVVAVKLQRKAFPIANVSFQVSRSEAQKKMREFVSSQGIALENFRSVTSFGYSSTVSDYIERDYSVSQLEQSVKQGVAVYYWTGRWFKPGEVEQYYAWMSPAGNIVGYSHEIEEGRELPSLEKADARALAENFLRKFITQHPLEKMNFVSDSVNRRPHRTDFTFTWEQNDLRLGEAAYRLHVTVNGNQIGSYGEGLRVPEGWLRKFSSMRELNRLCGTIAGYFLAALIIGFLVIFIRGVKNHDLRWTNAVPWQWLLLFAAVALFVGINNFPSHAFDYRTTQSWPSYLGGQVFSIARGIIFEVFGMWLLFLAADSLHRERLPGAITFRQCLRGAALRDPSTLRALGFGIIAATVSLAYVSLFYVAGRHFGVWCPVEINFSKVLSGWLPWVEPMQTGLMAAFSEEMLFRVMSILLIWWVCRSRWVAIILSAAIWAFLHSSYPQMPGYIRGVELTLVGIAWGILFLRYGIVATLTAHYLYDCWIGSIVIFQSASWGNKVGAVIVSLWPVALFLWGWMQKPKEIPLEDASLRQPLPPFVTPEKSAWINNPFLLLPRWTAILCAAAIALIIALSYAPQVESLFVRFGMLHLSRAQIAARADAILVEKGFKPAEYQRVISMGGSSIPSPGYLIQYGNLSQIADFFAREWPGVLWHVRYFKAMNPEEINLSLNRNGDLYVWSHKILREAPGAQLSEKDALALAEQTLIKNYAFNPGKEKLVETDPDQLEHRRDYQFVFERRNFSKWGEAKLRTSIKIHGDEPVGYSHYLKIPEAWVIEHERSGMRKLLKEEFSNWLGIAEYALFFTFFIVLFRRRVVPWRPAFALALVSLAFAFFALFDNLPFFYQRYASTVPMGNYLITKVGGEIMLLVLQYLGQVLFIGISLGMLRWAFGFELRDLTLWPSRAQERARFWLTTFALALGGVALFGLEGFLKSTVAAWVVPSTLADYFHADVTNLFPGMSVLVAALKDGYNALWRIGFYAGLFALIHRRFPKLAWSLLFCLPIVQTFGKENWLQFFFYLTFAEIRLAMIAFLVARVWRFNAAAIFLAYAMDSLLGELLLFWQSGGPVYRWEILPPLAVCLCVLVAGIVAHFTAKARESRRPVSL